MRFDKYHPSEGLKPYIRYFVVSENDAENEYKVFPSAGLVIGFQYKGQLKTIKEEAVSNLSSAGITGIADSFRTFRNSANTGTVLIYFTETGFIHFAPIPSNELFNLSISLEDIFSKNSLGRVEEKLALATTDRQRIETIEHFLWEQHKEIQADQLIMEAVRLIYESKGTIRIRELIEKLFISQSPFEKRFRTIVGTTPKKFASIIRFNHVLDELTPAKSLRDICYENDFFDPAHFSRDFRHFTGESPENFKRLL